MITNITGNSITRKINIPSAGINAIFAAMLSAGILFLHYNRPVLYMGLILEDYWGEYATFVSYMLAFVLFSLAVVKNQSLRKPGYLLLAITMFLIAMDEISWGQRILNIETPYVITKLNYQSELSIHNIIDNAIPIEQLFFIAVLIWVFLLPIAVRIINPLSAFMSQWGIPRLGAEEYPYFLISLIFFIFKPIIKSDEIQEVLLAIAFASYAQTVFFDSLNRFAISTANIIKRKLALFFVVSVFTGFFVSTFGITIPLQNARLKGQLHWTAAIDYPKAKLYRQAEELFDHILTNESLIKNETLIQYGIFLSQSNNPKAEAVLKKALHQESEFEVKDPENPKSNRNKGTIYKLLKNDAQANAEFELAMQKDRNRLAKIKRDSEKYWPAVSMAKTCISMENYDRALENLNEAIKFAPGERERLNAQLWMDRITAKKEITRSQFLQMLQYIYL